MTTHRCVSTRPIDLADGRPVAPGERVRNLDVDAEHNQALVDAGVLIEETQKTEKPAQRAKTDGGS